MLFSKINEDRTTSRKAYRQFLVMPVTLLVCVIRWQEKVPQKMPKSPHHPRKKNSPRKNQPWKKTPQKKGLVTKKKQKKETVKDLNEEKKPTN